jgi:hypothetical protein
MVLSGQAMGEGMQRLAWAVNVSFGYLMLMASARMSLGTDVWGLFPGEDFESALEQCAENGSFD